jgi:hypothetical protein
MLTNPFPKICYTLGDDKENADMNLFCNILTYISERKWQNSKGQVHRTNGPAVISRDGTGEWWIHGERHRIKDKPAVVKSDGTEEWWIHNKKHRGSNKPAVIKSDGTKEWWVRGKRHRARGKPAVIKSDGTKEWWVHGKRHRARCKPAVIKSDGTSKWWVDGELKLVKDGDGREVKEEDVQTGRLFENMERLIEYYDSESYSVEDEIIDMEWSDVVVRRTLKLHLSCGLMRVYSNEDWARSRSVWIFEETEDSDLDIGQRIFIA